MKASHDIWKEALKGKLPEPIGSEVDQFETEIELRKQGKIDEKVFAETRLRRGAYGQRYDNGQRYDGMESRKLPYRRQTDQRAPTPCGMRRACSGSRFPFGGLNPAQLEMHGGAGRGVFRRHRPRHHPAGFPAPLHPHRKQAPRSCAGWRRSASRPARPAATRFAMSQPARIAGVCRDEAFDVTPYAHALAWFLMGHPDTMDFGRKFKPAFSGCAQHACGLTQMHDIGYVAAVREVDGRLQRGFKIVVGRRARSRAAPGPPPDRVRPGGGDAAADAGGLPGLRQAWREKEPQCRAHQVPGGQVGHREIPRGGLRRPARSSARTRAGSSMLQGGRAGRPKAR